VVQADLVETFAKVLGRKSIVNVLLERPPVYVLGPVRRKDLATQDPSNAGSGALVL
jgi:hypothetical protein